MLRVENYKKNIHQIVDAHVIASCENDEINSFVKNPLESEGKNVPIYSGTLWITPMGKFDSVSLLNDWMKGIYSNLGSVADTVEPFNISNDALRFGKVKYVETLGVSIDTQHKIFTLSDPDLVNRLDLVRGVKEAFETKHSTIISEIELRFFPSEKYARQRLEQLSASYVEGRIFNFNPLPDYSYDVLDKIEGFQTQVKKRKGK